MYDIIILGAGAAGLTAALYGARAGLKTCVIENMYAGGQFVVTAEIENMPGFKKISGYDLALLMLEQAQNAGAEIVYGEPVNYELDGVIKRIAMSDGKEIEGKTVIIATGAKARKLGLKDEERFTGRGIHYCATCDGGFYKGKTVAVIGGGNTAVSDAKYLSKIAGKVYLVHRRDALRAKGSEIEALNALENVEILYNRVADSVFTDEGKLRGIALRSTTDNTLTNIELDGIFVAIGLEPDTEAFKRAGVAVNDGGYIAVDRHGKTSVDGVFAAGDVTDTELRQIVTAAADGAKAAEYIASVIS